MAPCSLSVQCEPLSLAHHQQQEKEGTIYSIASVSLHYEVRYWDNRLSISNTQTIPANHPLFHPGLVYRVRPLLLIVGSKSA